MNIEKIEARVHARGAQVLTVWLDQSGDDVRGIQIHAPDGIHEDRYTEPRPREELEAEILEEYPEAVIFFLKTS